MVEFEERFSVYIKLQKQVEEDRKQLAENIRLMGELYKVIRDQLVAAGVKWEYLTDVIGQPPASKVKVDGATTGIKGKVILMTVVLTSDDCDKIVEYVSWLEEQLEESVDYIKFDITDKYKEVEPVFDKIVKGQFIGFKSG